VARYNARLKREAARVTQWRLGSALQRWRIFFAKTVGWLRPRSFVVIRETVARERASLGEN